MTFFPPPTVLPLSLLPLLPHIAHLPLTITDLHHGSTMQQQQLSQEMERKQRTIYHPWQIMALECAFKHHPYIVGSDRALLAVQLDLTESNVGFLLLSSATIGWQEVRRSETV